jgi:hypothetical protein
MSVSARKPKENLKISFDNLHSNSETTHEVIFRAQ